MNKAKYPWLNIKAAPAYLAPLLTPAYSHLFTQAARQDRAPLFDHTIDGETTEQREARHHQARTLCRICDARRECRKVAANTPPTNGFWE